MIKLNAKQLRQGPTPLKLREMVKLEKKDIYIVLDNVLDTYNIGSIFRLADAVAAKKIYLCGDTATPPNPRIKKASINTTEWVEWEYCQSALEAITKITSGVKKIHLVAIEQTDGSTPYAKFEYKLPLVLIVGNETSGVSKEVLDKCAAVVELPMFGVNKSLNVMVGLGVVLYKVIERLVPNKKIW